MENVLNKIKSLPNGNYVSYESTKSSTMIEYEIHMNQDVNGFYDFKKLDEFIKRNCELHDGKQELRIKIIGIGF